MTRWLIICLCLLPGIAGSAEPLLANHQELRGFVARMVRVHGFEQQRLEALFDGLQRSAKVLSSMSKPAESLQWQQYRKIFVTSERIRQGASFARKYQSDLERAYAEYGVPGWVIASIIGVETRYGRNKGGFSVLQSLATLAFYHRTRGEFFRDELEHFLLLTRDQGLSPQSLRGSYAGAMGIPQFISSSYRNYAVDFNADGKIDIWNDYTDAIGSVANYMHRNGWVKDGPVAHRVADPGANQKLFVARSAEPVVLSTLLGLTVDSATADSMVWPLRFYGANAEEYWLGFENFRVIMRYNHSQLYALAVYQLGDRIRSRVQG